MRSIDAWRPRNRVIAEGLLDAFADRGSFDLIAGFAAALPIVVIAEMLGVDPDDMAQFKHWSDARAQIFNPVRTPEQTVELKAAGQELDDYFARAIDARLIPTVKLKRAFGFRIVALRGGDRGHFQGRRRDGLRRNYADFLGQGLAAIAAFRRRNRLGLLG